jgi:hypothetical protein
MINIHPEYTVDEKKHRRMVLLPEGEWKQIVEELEELDDIRVYDKAVSEKGEAVLFEQAVREIGQDYKA